MQADVTPADVIQDDVMQADVIPADVIQADVIPADVIQADVMQADVTPADVTAADIMQADVIQADVIQADVMPADVIQADVISADVTPADVIQADVIPASPIRLRQERARNIRKRASTSQQVQAERMVKRSRVLLGPAAVGCNVTIPIPLVDRGRGDPRNLLGVITDKNENDMYKIAVKAGVLKSRFSRNQFEVCSYALLSDSDVNSNAEVSLRQAVTYESKNGGQGLRPGYARTTT